MCHCNQCHRKRGPCNFNGLRYAVVQTSKSQSLYALVSLLVQIMMTGEENFSINAYQELVNEYGYQLLTSNIQDSLLADELIKTCINEQVISRDKYRFSQSQEYFVPNKTQHQDVIEFIKVGAMENCRNCDTIKMADKDCPWTGDTSTKERFSLSHTSGRLFQCIHNICYVTVVKRSQNF